VDFSPPWPQAPAAPRLGPRDVHLFRIALDVPESTRAPLAGLLSADEAVRAARFVFERHRRRFLVGRAALRQILGRYLAAAPESLVFSYSERGRPSLPGAPFDFNLAHSEELALLALSPQPLGVDLELLRDVGDAAGIVQRFFSPAEAAAFARVPAGQRAQAFLNGWTRKEALLKAVGTGIADLHTVDVTLAPGEPTRVLAMPGPPDEAAAWQLHPIDPGPGFVGALAVRGRAEPLSAWEWTW